MAPRRLWCWGWFFFGWGFFDVGGGDPGGEFSGVIGVILVFIFDDACELAAWLKPGLFVVRDPLAKASGNSQKKR